MHDTALVKKLLSRTLYKRISPYIKEYAVSSETWKIVKVLNDYYRAFPAVEDVVVDEFKTFFFTVSKLKEEQHTLYTNYFTKLAKEEDSDVVEDVLRNYITKDYATKIMNMAVDVIHDKEDACIDNISAVVNEFNRELGRAVTKDDLFVSTDLSYVMKACSSPGYTWRLNEFNMSLGPLRQGDFVILAARPETGKTTCVASEVSWWATQLADASRPILWVNNEESSDKVMARIVQSFFGVTTEEMSSDVEHYSTQFKDKVGGRVLVVNDDAGMNDVKRLTSLFDEYNPSIIIFDQLDKVGGFYKMEREDLRIGKLYEWARDLAKKFGPVLAVSQVDGSGEGQQWINMAQLRGSKTDKIGEADAIITIGKSNKPEDEYKRFIHVPKNKLFGGPMSVEAHRHGFFEVVIQPEIARYKGVH